jgi:hypothetical protein
MTLLEDEIEGMKAAALADAEDLWDKWVGDSITRYDEIAKAAYITGFMHGEGWFEW